MNAGTGNGDTPGAWVATKDGKVIASSPDLRALVRLLRKMGRRGQGAIARYEPGVSS